MKRMAAAIFDMDGVIFNTEQVWKDSFEKANRLFSFDLTEEYRQNTCGKSEKIIREELLAIYPDSDVDEYRGFMLDYVKRAIDNGQFEIKPGVIEAIEMLKNNHYKIALATSSHKQRAEMLFSKKNLDLHKLFDTAVFAEDVNFISKPNPQIFLTAAQALNQKPDDCYVFEDSLNGIEAAVSGGFVPIMIVDLIEPNKFCYDNCKKIIRSCKEIESLIKNYESN